ncbi:MAG: transcription elongation factor GreA [Oscillospiraceae bacterium]|nr:transcription elongation factor GreA [Oscillospiraceae bacterium]
MQKTLKQLLVTADGLKKMEDECEYLKTIRRKEIIDTIGIARAFGDLSENSEYDEAKNEQAKVEARIMELEEQLKYVKVMDESDIKTDEINIGNKVKVRNLNLDKEIIYSLVGSMEADPFKNKISDESPIGKVLVGSKKGETVEYETPRGIFRLEILDISKIKEE